MTLTLLTPTPLSSAVSHVIVHAVALEDHKAKVPVSCKAGTAVTKPQLRGWASRYVVISRKQSLHQSCDDSGGFRVFFFHPHQPIRALTEAFLRQEAGQ